MKSGEPERFECIFNPRTVAVIGASDSDGFSQAMMNTKMRDKLFLVNPRYEELQGKRCYASILDINGEIDYVVLAGPALVVPMILDECIRKGVKAVHVFTAGFCET